MADQRIRLFSEYSETGYRGEYSTSIRYDLIVGEGNIRAVAILEETVDKEAYKSPDEREVTRYQLGVKELVALIRANAKRIDG